MSSPLYLKTQGIKKERDIIVYCSLQIPSNMFKGKFMIKKEQKLYIYGIGLGLQAK